ncbi:MAG: hypothetical protein ORN21_05850 [Methylophilaceae bacterium]|nr:hypothetical protein [Methylophilaceae bacterium]
MFLNLLNPIADLLTADVPRHEVAGAFAVQIRRYLSVTRKVSLTAETKSIFCDWISMYQDFTQPIPKLHIQRPLQKKPKFSPL